MIQEFAVRTQARSEFKDITTQVQDAVGRAGIDRGLCQVFVPHTTAGVTINENADPDVTIDLIAALDRLVPRDAGYRHREGNSDAHLKASLMGFSVMLPVSAGRLALGTWQAVYFCEFDGPRSRRVVITLIDR